MTANGQIIPSDVFNGQVDYAWGVFAVTAAAAVLLVSGIRMQDAEVDDSTPQPASDDSE